MRCCCGRWWCRQSIAAPAWAGGSRMPRCCLARKLGARHAYLLTDTAEAFFRRRGFEVIDRTDVPAAIRNSVEFAVACPASAIAMHRAVTLA